MKSQTLALRILHLQCQSIIYYQRREINDFKSGAHNLISKAKVVAGAAIEKAQKAIEKAKKFVKSHELSTDTLKKIREEAR